MVLHAIRLKKTAKTGQVDGTIQAMLPFSGSERREVAKETHRDGEYLSFFSKPDLHIGNVMLYTIFDWISKELFRKLAC